ncbi:MAG: hypothetical protein HQL13_05440 [Candidatus Omnitrophica bacterium]|nr:hypothetical protein [Candidatus Omnitrophota bacterium]
MIAVYSENKGLMGLLLGIAGTLVLLAAFFWGLTNIIQLFLPLLILFSYLLIVIFVFGILPWTARKGMKPLLALYSLRMSYALGAATWLLSLYIVIKAFGFWGILFIFAFKFLAPIAFAGVLFKGAWYIAAHLLLWMGFTHGMRVYSQWLSQWTPSSPAKDRVIDIDAIEVDSSEE